MNVEITAKMKMSASAKKRARSRPQKNKDFVFGVGANNSMWSVLRNHKWSSVESIKVFWCSQCRSNHVIIDDYEVEDVEDITNRGSALIRVKYRLRCWRCGKQWRARREVNV